jgi:hypothetical protein
MHSRFQNWFSLDTRSLALARIAFGICLLIDLVTRLLYVEWHYSDNGLIPVDIWFSKVKWAGSSPLYALKGSVVWVTILLITHIVITLLMTVGWRTAWMTALNAIMLTSLHDRNPFIQNSGDKVALVMLIIATFLPWGEFYSIDQRRRKTTTPRLVSGSWVGCFYLMVFMIYFVSFCFKIQNPRWTDLTALSYLFSGSEKITSLGSWLGQFPAFLSVTAALVLFVHGVLVQVLLLGWIFPSSWEWYLKKSMSVVFVIFHFLTAVTFFGIGVFPFYCVAIWLAILPSGFWNNSTTFLSSWRLSKIEAIGVVQFFVILFFYVGLLKPFGLEFKLWTEMAKWTRMAQTWTMFQEAEPGRLKWLTHGVLGSGKVIDLTPDEIPNAHWSKLHGNMVKLNFLHRYYVSAICRQNEQLKSVELRLRTSGIANLGQQYANEGEELVDRLDCKEEIRP